MEYILLLSSLFIIQGTPTLSMAWADLKLVILEKPYANISECIEWN